jgi:hypothetical protein
LYQGKETVNAPVTRGEKDRNGMGGQRPNIPYDEGICRKSQLGRFANVSRDIEGLEVESGVVEDGIVEDQQLHIEHQNVDGVD